MPFVYLRNRHHSTQFASFFIAVLMIHVAVIQSVRSPHDNTLSHQNNIHFLESFAIQAEDAIQSQDANTAEANIQAHHLETSLATHDAAAQRLEPEGIKTSLDSIEKNIKPTNSARNTDSSNNKAENLQTSITPPQATASVLSNPPPPYPRQSRRLGEQGKVLLAAEIATNGKAIQALISISSGYPRLDRAALESVLKWQFIPGKKAGVPQKMWVNIPINFVLE